MFWVEHEYVSGGTRVNPQNGGTDLTEVGYFNFLVLVSMFILMYRYRQNQVYPQSCYIHNPIVWPYWKKNVHTFITYRS